MDAMTRVWDRLPMLEATAELGRPESGIMGARIVNTAMGEYYIKHDHWNDQQGTSIVANEFLSAVIAQSMMVPIPHFSKVAFEGKLCFGSAAVRFTAPFVNESRLSGCANRDSLYALLVFDVWMDNRDRHNQNVLIGQQNGRTVFWAIDHSHCPFPPGRKPRHLLGFHGPHDGHLCVRAWYSQLITDATLLKRAIDAAYAIPEDSFNSLVPGVPGQDWRDEDVTRIVEFLVKRRSNLKEMVNQARGIVPALKGGDL